MREACREYDYTARMNGDESAIIAPSMPPGLIAERSLMLIALAQQAGREVCGKDLLSLSLGAAFYPKDGSDTDKLLAEADRRMYAAKRFHYDQVELIPPGAPQLARVVVVN